MGFETQIRKIISGGIPPTRQTLFYTATWPRAVRSLAYEFLRSPVQIEVGDINAHLNVNKDITQLVHIVRSQSEKQQVTAMGTPWISSRSHALFEEPPPQSRPTEPPYLTPSTPLPAPPR